MASDEHAGRILLELDVMGDIQAQLEKVASNIKSTLSKSMSGYKIDLAGISKEAGKQGSAIGKKLRDAISKATEKSSEIEVEADTSSIKNDVNSISENVASELRGVVDGILRELRQAIQGINSSIAVVPKASGSSKTKDGASSVRRARAPPVDMDTDSIKAEMTQLEELIAAAEKRANGFRETMDSLKNQLNNAFSDISMGVTKVDREVREMMYESTKGELTPLIEKANQSMNRAGNEALRLQNKYAALEKKLQDVEKANKKSASLFSRLGSAAKGVGSVLSSVFRKAGGPIKNFIGHVGSAVSKMTGLRGIISRFGNSASKASGGIFRLANMLKLMAIRMALRGVINGAKEGLQNLAQYSGEVNGSMSMLISALAQLKNAFATAFAPILNLVAPVLSTLISLLTQAATAIASFFAALTGKSSVIVAKKVTSDYAASLNGTAGAAGAANEALKEEQKTLMGFDQINKLDAPSDNGGSGGGGAGGGMAAGDMFEEVPIESKFGNFAQRLKDLFAKEDFTGIGSLIGEKINAGLTKIDNLIKWDNIGAKITKVISGITDTVNGMVSSIDWGLFGTTIGDGLNTAIYSINTFVDGIDWSGIGSALATSLNNIFETVDFGELGRLLGSKFRIIGDALYGAVTTLDWSNIGQSLAEGTMGLFDSFNLAQLGTTIGTGISGLASSLSSYVASMDWAGIGSTLAASLNNMLNSIDFKALTGSLSDLCIGLLETLKIALLETDWFALGRALIDAILGIDWLGLAVELIEVGLILIGGLVEGILGGIEELVMWLVDGLGDALSSAGDWFVGLWDTIVAVFSPIVQWFSDRFNETVESITSIFMSIGDFFAGVWQGIKDIFSSVGSWFKERFTESVENIKNVFCVVGDFFSSIWQGIKNIFSAVGNWFKEQFNTAVSNIRSVFSSIGSFFSGIWSGIKNVFSSVGSWFKGIFQGAWDGIKNVFSKVGDFFGGIWNTIKSTFSTIGTKVADAIGGAFKSAINAVIATVEGAINLIPRAINGAIGLINKLPGVNISTIPLVSLPRLATGGVIDTPTLAMIGENGQEAVMPLEKNTGWIDSLAQKLNDRSGSKDDSQIIEILMMILKVLQEIGAMDVYMDTTKVTDIIIKELRARKKRTGKDPVYS